MLLLVEVCHTGKNQQQLSENRKMSWEICDVSFNEIKEQYIDRNLTLLQQDSTASFQNLR